MSKSKEYKFDDFVREAAVDDYVLAVDGDRKISVKAPTGKQVFDAQKLGQERGDPATQLRFICGDATDEILALLEVSPAGAINGLIGSILKHFGMDTGEAQAPPN